MSYELLKKKAAEAALAYIKEDEVIGIGTGSTVYYLIEALAKAPIRLRGAVASSEATEAHLREKNIPVLNLNEVSRIACYIDGADAVADDFCLIKGRGGALTREKIIAYTSEQFICIVDERKWIHHFNREHCPPVPIEVLPFAQRTVEETIRQLGGAPILRPGKTDNGNLILDVKGLDLAFPQKLESELNKIPGVVENGLFAQRKPEYVLVADTAQVHIRSRL